MNIVVVSVNLLSSKVVVVGLDHSVVAWVVNWSLVVLVAVVDVVGAPVVDEGAVEELGA